MPVTFIAQIQYLIILITLYMPVLIKLLYSNFLTMAEKWNFNDHEPFGKIKMRSMRNHDMQGLLLRWGSYWSRLSQRWWSINSNAFRTFVLGFLPGRVRYTILIIRLNYLSDHLTHIRKNLERKAPIKLLEKWLHTRQRS